MSKFDVVVIGSGLGGLQCAGILSKEGLSVCLLEKNNLFGGCLQTFRHKGYMLDTGIHYIGGLAEGEVLNQTLKYLGVMDKLHFRRLDDDGFDHIWFHGLNYKFAAGHDRFVDVLAAQFPDQRDGLKRYDQLLKDVGNTISVDLLKKGVVSLDGERFFGLSANGVICDCVSDDALRNVLAGTNLLYGGVRDKSTFYQHAMVINSYVDGAYRFEGGSQQIADEMVAQIRANGGVCRNLSEVTRIIVEDDVLKGVEINGEERIEADKVISDVHPQVTLGLVDHNRFLRKSFATRINILGNSYGMFTLYLLMKPGQVPYCNYNDYLHFTDSVWFEPKVDPTGSTNFFICHQTPVAGQQTVDVISVLTPMFMSDVEAWRDTRAGHRGADYLQFKQDMSDVMIKRIKEFGFKFADNIADTFATTPLSYRDYTNTVDGSAYGVLKDYTKPLVTFINPHSKLPGLLFTGQNLNLHGALGVTLTSIFTCADLLGEEYLAKKIGNA